ncbi:SubName: Full=Uncharacterized protein {ECO:0000313/EMBL:CCA78026.1} [Serendipita indica DSM 11827]|uniref:BTB domain-containing protein n=1 Tax=Serendipita indica (strain DSM 11827) TaxID=1109443 RepID=G4U367_SERID|nr:SubName: Full=Uncharacterized protein {ECO:0000313/EMBL:CCA78026.1} [Serendipita indica DSM 11827]CCA78026.1 hypothetical protein PIIN_06878 [Serendipita indica DSM 11827]
MSVTNESAPDVEQTRRSDEFPQGYGDVELISSDKVIFSFHRYLLCHCSPIFKDMFVVGTSKSPTNDSIPYVILSEDSATLDALLRFFDPEKEPLPMNNETIVGLLEAARKYQVPRVMKWWEREMQIDLVATQKAKLQHPMLCLVLADRYGVRNVARVAARELIKAPADELQVDLPFESRLLVLLDTLRRERITQLTQIVDKLVTQAIKAFITKALSKSSNTSATASALNAGNVHSTPPKTRKSTDSAHHGHGSKTLANSTTSLELQTVLLKLTSWTINLTMAVSKEPNWEVVSRAFDGDEPIEWQRFMEKAAFKVSETRITQLEAEFPVLPSWVGDV